MINRRTFQLALAGAAASLVGGSTAGAAAQDDAVFTAYGMRYDWHPIKALGNWPLDHIAVATSAGTQWGCFGRTYAGNQDIAKPIVTGRGDELWARAIAGSDGSAGIENGVTGLCDQCANRILLPAGVDVRDSVGNEIATLFCGIYGFGMSALVERIEDAAAAVNKAHPGRVPDEAIAAAVARAGGGLKDEWLIVRANTERIVKPALGARWDALKSDIEAVYLSFYHRRMVLFHAYERGHIDKAALVVKLRDAFTASLGDLADAIGAEDYAKIVPVPVAHMGDYMRHKTLDQQR